MRKSEAIEQFCQLIADKLRQEQGISGSDLAVWVAGEIKANPESYAVLMRDGSIQQINEEVAKAFQTQVQAGGKVYYGGQHFHLSNPEECQKLLESILRQLSSDNNQASKRSHPLVLVSVVPLAIIGLFTWSLFSLLMLRLPRNSPDPKPPLCPSPDIGSFVNTKTDLPFQVYRTPEYHDLNNDGTQETLIFQYKTEEYSHLIDILECKKSGEWVERFSTYNLSELPEVQIVQLVPKIQRPWRIISILSNLDTSRIPLRKQILISDVSGSGAFASYWLIGHGNSNNLEILLSHEQNSLCGDYGVCPAKGEVYIIDGRLTVGIGSEQWQYHWNGRNFELKHYGLLPTENSIVVSYWWDPNEECKLLTNLKDNEVTVDVGQTVFIRNNSRQDNPGRVKFFGDVLDSDKLSWNGGLRAASPGTAWVEFECFSQDPEPRITIHYVDSLD